ncbi:polysaccharide pyruvyl transferase family protein [Brevundimonas sp. SGAir0440]|uniref:polysaccharide pyruvyl transferase family protein n=1 Tax=Brevundimonas sp. SGAir0440 TaxID=2579977 RepID=UPI0010CD1DD9|nr:polysaccharide pyruvyl transferase family protein [Brevundimonas sp. SGAir0440]QCQ98694.1 polysaccharide pyruvyl transferase family protein [Brevundimonas sp. SGAir0440]
MFKNIAVMGVKDLAAWDDVTTVSQALADLGNNSGNLMFTHALQSVVRGSVSVGFNPDQNMLSSCEAIIIAAANWVNEFEDFGWLYSKLKTTKVPIFLVGIGAQASTTGLAPNVPEGTRKLLSLVSERSYSISCRGDYSAEVLASLGITNVAVTGCPSLLTAGIKGPSLTNKRILKPSDIVIHGTRHFFQRADIFQESIYRTAFNNGHDLIIQSELADIYYALERKGNADILSRSAAVLPDVYGADIDLIDKYLRSHGHFYTNVADWAAYMAGKSFCIGTRIHGTIASLLAGTPAVLIAHDSRTREMAVSMSIPSIDTRQAVSFNEDLIEEIVSGFESASFLASYDSYYASFSDFFSANGLSIRHSF